MMPAGDLDSHCGLPGDRPTARPSYRSWPAVVFASCLAMTAESQAVLFTGVTALRRELERYSSHAGGPTAHNLAGVLHDTGLLLIGGEFGRETRNVQFHKIDHFSSWKEHATAAIGAEVLVNKRVRSLAQWHAATADCGLQICDLIRSDADPKLMTPENDVLVLRLAADDGT
jgi:hypothetical protein